MDRNKFTCIRFVATIATVALPLFLAQNLHAEEEKSMWQKFVDWFKPAPSLEGEGPLYDELREMETKIDRLEGRYSRERRPGNKTRLKKELEDLRTQRDKLVAKIRAEEKAKKTTNVSAAAKSSSSAANTSSAAMSPASSTKTETDVAPFALPANENANDSAATSAEKSATPDTVKTEPDSAAVKAAVNTILAAIQCKPETVYVHDTIMLHDTLYVIVADPAKQQPTADSTHAGGNAGAKVQPSK